MNISASHNAALRIADDSSGDVTITIADGTTNTLTGAQLSAGIQKNGGTGTLTINGGENGTGTLIATGGAFGAGIGSAGSLDASSTDCSNIIINGGNITATGGNYAAGIGGGSRGETAGNASNITINGGTVSAQGDIYGAGIGGGGSHYGAGGNGTYITISGGNVKATGGYSAAGIGGGGTYNKQSGSGSHITISDNQVEAHGGRCAAGIGGGGTGGFKGGLGSDITISSGTVIAAGYHGTGIGGGFRGNCSGVTISGGTVTASSAEFGSAIGSSSLAVPATVSDIHITGGSVKTSTEQVSYPHIGNGVFATEPTNSAGEKLYSYTYDNIGDYQVKVDGEDYSPINHRAADSSDSCLYLYLTKGEHTVQFLVDGNWLQAPLVTPPEPVEKLQYTGGPQELITAGSTTLGTLVYSLEENGIYSPDIPTGTEPGAYTIWYKVEGTDKSTGTSPKSVETKISAELLSIAEADGSELVKDTDYSYENSVLTVMTERYVVISSRDRTVDHSIAVAAGISANITLAGVDIDVSKKENTAALLIKDGGTGVVRITLADGTENKLKSGYGCAGLQKNDGNISLVIDGKGSLKSEGGIGGAGIGGGVNASGSNIVINDGTINAVTSVGYDQVNNIWGGSGIGGGYKGTGSIITINGGVVTAVSKGDGAGIGGGINKDADNIVISGGSVKASASDSRSNDIGGGAGAAALTPTNGTENVYLLTIDNPSGYAVTIDGVKYPTHDDNKVYAYLTGTKPHAVRVGTAIKIYTYDLAAKQWTTGQEFTAPAAGADLVYNGKDQALATPGEAAGFTMLYSNAKDGDYSATIPTGINADKYTVWYKIMNSDDLLVGPDFIEAEISRRPVKVTADDADKTYGESDPPGLAYTVDTATPLVDGDDLIGELSRKSGENTGDYAIMQGTLTNRNNPNYDITFTAGTFTINPADISTAAAEQIGTLTYNGIERTPEFTVTLDGETLTVNDYDVTVTPQKNAGNYTEEITGTGNYSGTATGNWSIGKAAATITANSYTIQVGGALPAFDYKVSGLIGRDTLPVEVTASCAADGSAAGRFPITVSGAAESTNYTYTYVNGTLTVTEKDIQTVTAGDLTLTYGDTNKKITAETSGSGALSYAVATGTDVISVSADGAVTILKAGVATGDITAAETSDYAEATKTVTVTVNKAAATVTANSFTIQIGDTLPTFDYKVSGLVNGETVPVNVTVTCTAADSKTAGIYAIKVSGAAESDNYYFTYVNGALTITTKDIQTITADDLTLTYGDSGRKITAEVKGGAAISYAVKTGTDVISVAADGTVTALKSGVATVELTAAETADYAEAATTVTVTVNRAAVTIAAKDYTVNQGEALPGFDYTVTGLVNGDKLAFTPVLTCAAADSRTAGTYEITVSIEVTEDDRYTYATRNGALTVKRKSSGGGTSGGTGGGTSGGYRPTTPSEPSDPSIGGASRSWSSIAADLAKLTPGSEVTIDLNGNTTVPAEVIRVIAERKLRATFTVDSVKSWKTDGAEIKTPAAADLSVIPTLKLKTDALRGIQGIQFTVNSTNIPTSLAVAFRSEHAGKFANLYREVSGKLVFVSCAKLGADGKVILPGVTEKGDYAVMLCEFSDLPGDVSNDGVMNALDAGAILKDITGLEPAKNPLMADFNGDGIVNAMDASAILKRIVGIA